MKIEVINLKRVFGRTTAVENISFSFESGQIMGFVGPNGAGKTTTMRIMATLDEPTFGDVRIDGVSIIEEPEFARERVGYVPDSLPVHRDITIHEYLDFFARTYGMRGERRTQLIDQIEEFTNLVGIRDKFLDTLSKGMKQRVCLARALIHDPGILIMDEPAAGLDPRARIELRELLRELSTQGKAILISSHILTELSEICNGAIIIEQGRLLTAGSLDMLLRDQKEDRRKIMIRAHGRESDLCRRLLEMPHIETAAVSGDSVEVIIEGGEAACVAVLAALVKDGFPISEFRHHRTDLETIFMNVTKGEVQ
ncbi:MAG: ABC transporter ATP-binding protein [Candidatus Riflebacteria bacterium]|nr:ABC transporter ATP-binding protein [Candidatus Riflebacteria bacterium]